MDFSNHRLARSSIDTNRYVNKVNQSMSYIDKSIEQSSMSEHTAQFFRDKLSDPSIDSAFIKKCMLTISQKDMLDIADYSLRKADNPGRAFVKLCSNVMNYKTI